jgi:Holliday junction resolvase
MSTATKGRAFEHAIRHLFESAGYSVIRGAGSKGEFLDDKVDLVATKQTRLNEFTVYLTVVGVQCKVKAQRSSTKQLTN